MRKKKLLTRLVAAMAAIMLCACGGSEDATFSGSKTGDKDHYELEFEFLNTTYSHELEMNSGERILVHIEKEDGDITVNIRKGTETPVYEGNGEVAADFSVYISEKGTYTVSVTGKNAKGRVSFTRDAAQSAGTDSQAAGTDGQAAGKDGQTAGMDGQAAGKDGQAAGKDSQTTSGKDAQAAVTPEPTPTTAPYKDIYKEWDMTNIDTSWIDPDKKLVAFTFDDGPTTYYGQLLDTLEEYGMHATFFVWGNHYNSSYKDEIERVVAMGCELGNHTWSHPYLTNLTPDRVAEEIEKTRTLLESITGISDYLVRPPYGSSNMTVAETIKVPLINWSLDTADWNNGTYDTVYAALTERVKDGDVVLMHASYGFTAEAVKDAIPVLIDQGYQIVSVSELCAVRGKRLTSGTSPLSSAVRKE